MTKHVISVSVLDGVYLSVIKYGLPISVSVHLQDTSLQFNNAWRMARQSKSGFFVCFFGIQCLHTPVRHFLPVQ